MEKQIILASGSPRRIEMMKKNGYDPIICPADIDENIPLNHGMKETVMFLSFKKAQWVREKLKDEITSPSTIIAADTIVYFEENGKYTGGEIMGKPIDFDDGFRMLYKIRNTFHYVCTGVTLMDLETGHSKVFTEITKVWLKDYSKEDLEEYLKTDEAYDKAGGYAIQGYFARYVDHIEGDYNNVVGFPWDSIMHELKAFV